MIFSSSYKFRSYLVLDQESIIAYYTNDGIFVVTVNVNLTGTVYYCAWHVYSEKQVAQLSQRDRAAGWVIAKSGRLKLGYNIYGHYRYIFNHCDVFDQQINRNRRKKHKIRAITPLKVIQGHRGRYQSKARMRLPITDNGTFFARCYG